MDTSSSRTSGPPHRERRPVLPVPDRATRGIGAARESIGLAALAVERARRGALARMRRSRLLRWRHRAPIADDLMLAPPDLRPLDPSFVDEIESGGFGLCGFTARVRGTSPFAVPAPSECWLRELHGFGWLRHFGAAWSQESETLAQRLVAEWIDGRRRHAAAAWVPEVVGRRVVSWLSHAPLILNGSARRPYTKVMLSLEDQVTYLSATWKNAPAGHPRLLALIGLTQAALCIAGHESKLGVAERLLLEELRRQILTDGGHVSRNPQVLVELLLDLLPLKQCFVARGLTPDPFLPAAIDRMMAMLHHLRLGDGQLARFNGTGASERDALATVLAYDKGIQAPREPATASGYVRLQRAATVLLVDAGPPPPLDLAGDACAGCLSFEMSSGAHLVLVNGGAPAPAHERSAAAARGTASHNTLELGGQPSARLVRSAGLARLASGAPIQHPDHVSCDVQETESAVTLTASHDGYLSPFNVMHTRTLALSTDGTRVDGIDRLDGPKGDQRFSWDVPFAVHFHLHPRSAVRLNADGSAAVMLTSGEQWRVSASGATLGIEESTHYADVLGPLRAMQVVLRGVCYGAAEVRWKLERVGTEDSARISGPEPGAAASVPASDEGSGELA